MTPRSRVVAKEILAGEIDALRDRSERIQREKAALENGLHMWKEVLSILRHLERSIRVGKLKVSELKEGFVTGQEQLERHLQVAQDSQWGLIEAIVSAELAAVHEGLALVTSFSPKIA